MIQPYNRYMSFSLYISALAVSDTFALTIGKWVYKYAKLQRFPEPQHLYLFLEEKHKNSI